MGNIAKARIKTLLRQSQASYFDNVADSIVTLSDSQTLSGNTSIQKCAVASGSNDAVTLTAASNGGRVTWVPDVTADRIYTLPTPAAGLHLNMVGAGALAADGHDVTFVVASANSEFFHGSLLHHDTDGDTVATIWGDGAANDTIKITLPEAFDIHFLGKSTTVWYVWGWVASVTNTTIANS